jgi:hypothetical protein
MDARSLLEAEALFGWPIGTIDELAELSRQAYEDEISYLDWRSRDRELRAPLPPLSDQELNALASLQTELIRSEADYGTFFLLDHRLGAMREPAPDSAELLLRISYLKDRAKSADPELRVCVNKRIEQFSRWLRERR